MRIGGINLSKYYKVSQMNLALNKFMREINITKTQLSNSLISSINLGGIGEHVDILA